MVQELEQIISEKGFTMYKSFLGITQNQPYFVSNGFYVWEPGKVHTAVCTIHDHRAPDENCTCGLYGTKDLQTLADNHHIHAPSGNTNVSVTVVAKLKVWGKVCEFTYGYRAEKAWIEEIYVYHYDNSNPNKPNHVKYQQLVLEQCATLEAAYRVPVKPCVWYQAPTRTGPGKSAAPRPDPITMEELIKMFYAVRDHQEKVGVNNETARYVHRELTRRVYHKNFRLKKRIDMLKEELARCVGEQTRLQLLNEALIAAKGLWDR